MIFSVIKAASPLRNSTNFRGRLREESRCSPVVVSVSTKQPGVSGSSKQHATALLLDLKAAPCMTRSRAQLGKVDSPPWQTPWTWPRPIRPSWRGRKHAAGLLLDAQPIKPSGSVAPPWQPGHETRPLGAARPPPFLSATFPGVLHDEVVGTQPGPPSQSQGSP